MNTDTKLLLAAAVAAAILAVLAGCTPAQASSSEEAPDRAGFGGQMGVDSSAEIGMQ
jgi:hypothetical protein